MRLAEVFTRNSTLVMRVTDVWHARYWCFVTPGIDVTPVLVFVALAINELSIYILYIYCMVTTWCTATWTSRLYAARYSHIQEPVEC